MWDLWLYVSGLTCFVFAFYCFMNDQLFRAVVACVVPTIAFGYAFMISERKRQAKKKAEAEKDEEAKWKNEEKKFQRQTLPPEVEEMLAGVGLTGKQPTGGPFKQTVASYALREADKNCGRSAWGVEGIAEAIKDSSEKEEKADQIYWLTQIYHLTQIRFNWPFVLNSKYDQKKGERFFGDKDHLEPKLQLAAFRFSDLEPALVQLLEELAKRHGLPLERAIGIALAFLKERIITIEILAGRNAGGQGGIQPGRLEKDYNLPHGAAVDLKQKAIKLAEAANKRPNKSPARARKA